MILLPGFIISYEIKKNDKQLANEKLISGRLPGWIPDHLTLLQYTVLSLPHVQCLSPTVHASIMTLNHFRRSRVEFDPKVDALLFPPLDRLTLLI